MPQKIKQHPSSFRANGPNVETLKLDGGQYDLKRIAQQFPGGASFNLLGNGDSRLSFDNECVHGSATSIAMHFGMQLTISDFMGRLPMALSVEHAPSELDFAICRGSGTYAVAPGGERVEFTAGDFHVAQIKKSTRFRWLAPQGSTEQSIHLKLSKRTLIDLLGVQELPTSIANIVDSSAPFSMAGLRVDQRMNCITDEIFEVSQVMNETRVSSVGASTLSKKLFLEAKTMELIAALVERMERPPQKLEPSPEEFRPLLLARELLLADLENPPSVTELAKRVGMGERRFKERFKLAFGSPVMTYARKQRLERARELLSAHQYNVTQVAHLVGYANPSKFAAAYRRQYGMSPSTL